MHERVAVGVGRRHVVEHDGFAVQEEVARGREEGVHRQRAGRCVRVGLDRGGHHAVVGILVAHHARRLRSAGAELHQRLIAAGVIAVQVRVDDGVDWFVRQRADGREQLRRHRRGPGVHEQHAIVTNLDRHVAGTAREQVHVLLHAHDADVSAGRVGGRTNRRLRGSSRRALRGHEHQSARCDREREQRRPPAVARWAQLGLPPKPEAKEVFIARMARGSRRSPCSCRIARICPWVCRPPSSSGTRDTASRRHRVSLRSAARTTRRTP